MYVHTFFTFFTHTQKSCFFSKLGGCLCPDAAHVTHLSNVYEHSTTYVCVRKLAAIEKKFDSSRLKNSQIFKALWPERPGPQDLEGHCLQKKAYSRLIGKFYIQHSSGYRTRGGYFGHQSEIHDIWNFVVYGPILKLLFFC